MNKAALNCYVQVLCGHKFSDHLRKYPGVQLLDHVIVICLVLQETVKLSCKLAITFAPPPATNEKSCCFIS